MSTAGALLAVAVALAPAGATDVAATRIYVALAGRDDTVSKLGLPGISVVVDAAGAEDAVRVRDEILSELAEACHTRTLDRDEPGDYALTVRVVREPPGGSSTIRFEVTLDDAKGERLWRVEGRVESDTGAIDPDSWAGIGRNVVSALVHDGWVQARYDPDNPPPQAPQVRKDVDR